MHAVLEVAFALHLNCNEMQRSNTEKKKKQLIRFGLWPHLTQTQLNRVVFKDRIEDIVIVTIISFLVLLEYCTTWNTPNNAN